MPELDEYRISELDPIATLDNNDLIEVSHQSSSSESGYVSGKAPLTQVANKIVNNIQYVTELQTESKTIVGAINEVAQGGGGTTDYDDLEHKPQINSVELSGNKSLDDLGIQPSEISKTASGSVATFTDGGNDIPVKAFECEIVAQQESGTPTPANPLSIIGVSEADIGDISDATNITYFKGVLEGKYGFVDLGSLTWVKDTTTLSITVFRASINDRAGGTLYGICDKYFASTDTRDYLVTHDMSMTRWNATGTNVAIRDDSLSSGTATDFTTAVTGVYLIYELATPTTPTITPEQFKSLCAAFGISSDMFIVEFGQTIYGGRLIYANGSWAIEADKGMSLISDLDWYYNEPSTRFAATDLRDIIKNAESTLTPLEGLSCECYVNDVASSSRQIDLSIAVSTSGIMVLKDTNYTDVSNLLSAVGNYKIVYPLETPVIIPITSSTRVKTLSGNNNIFSNTGDVELEYFTNKADEIAELIEIITGNTPSSILYGTTTPDNLLGENGSVYVKYTVGTGGASDKIDALYVKLDDVWVEYTIDVTASDVSYSGALDTDNVSGAIEELVNNSAIRKNVSGSICSFTAPSTDTLVNCVSEVSSGSTGITLFVRGANLFNKATITASSYINSSGQIQSSSVGFVSDYIPIKPNTKYYETQWYDSDVSRYIAFYKADKSYLSVAKPTFSGGTFTTPANAYYVRVSAKNAYLNTLMVVLGDTAPTSYTAYVGNDYTVSFDETLSGDGTFDFLSGVLTRSDSTTKQLTANAVSTLNGFNNMFSTGGALSLSYKLSSIPARAIKYEGSSGLSATDVNSAIDEVYGKWLTATLTTGSTTVTISDASITTTSTIDIYVSEFGIQPTNAVVATGSITLTFLAQASDITVKVRVS